METTRRQVLTAAAGLGLALSGMSGAAEEKGMEEIPATEDLMREHGVLDRVLLIYEEGIRRIRSREEVAPELFTHTAQLVRKFVEDYHEKLEEQFIFPAFRNANRHTDLVTTLKRQHEAGRAVTDAILRLAAPDRFRSREERGRLADAAASFIRMYRPHSAREDTVLFPALREILTAKQIDELGEQFEEQEHKLFGEEGFEKTVSAVAGIERQLGIYDLDQFTPRPPCS
ncbi:MAG: hemerythrin domain-containing protein [Armatimonadota bacterium]